MPEISAAPVTAPTDPQVRLGTEIAGLGVAVPENVVANAPIAARFGIDESWIVTRTGIDERRIAAPEERLSQFAAAAGERALAAAGIEAAELDLLLVATTSNDDLMPGASPRVAAALGAGVAAIDLNAACTGFVSGIALACGQIESGRAANVLLVGADLMSRITDPTDRGTAAVFADGAGAIVLRGENGGGRIGPIVLGSDGSQADLVLTPRSTGLTVMQGHETFRHAVERMSEATLAAAEAAGVTLADVDLFVYHQANARILRSVGERLELPMSRVVDSIHHYGNTSAASIPLALEDARLAGDLRPGATVLLAAFGAGLTWGATVIKWGSASDE
ncbi:MAG: 3-oxoacyl-[acyl-carrier-protein] synthase [Solirubrobacterales bacterium]|jgi:3-oxoacyl-[acyl-carrier-protein] synthase-3|nr:3-oxoacyl-[acyl-carrier-protein] synthase [Solirubrobacterales bacterium]